MNRSRLVFLSLLIASVGCSKGNPNAPAEVSGKVTFKNTPVTAGTVTFYAPDNKGVYPITIKPDGTYSQVDLPIGEMTITVETESINPDKKKGAQTSSSGQKASMSPAPKGSGGGGASEG
ncbi:MAG TPA: hypothetical protein VGZ25_05850, partial [Gemmataceae bacterium]|nr:hypothetical protein [Gemmataceae bacterium]